MKTIIFTIIFLVTSCYKGEDYVVLLRAGQHSDERFPSVYISKKKMSYDITFTPSCRYDIGSDQSDNNKLFGVGYLPTHRQNSVRFGWWYNPAVDSIEISAYIYEQGERHIFPLTRVGIGECATYRLDMSHDVHDLEVVGKAKMRVLTRSSTIMYMLHSYFGGNRPAPHNIYIEMTKS